MTTRPTNLDSLAAAYESVDERRQLEARAGAYNPDRDAEAERIKQVYADLGEPIPAAIRMQIGFQESAREAAHAIKDYTKKDGNK